ncbi:MAG: hypothetical protein MUE34_04235, partial [Acidimicrobiales bacterium]|nr:hypothetical protein [Acidimicrobiales bacterium]
MGLHLGIDIGSERTVAAVERDGTPGVLRLGTEAAMPSVAHVAADGSVTVGEAAFERARTEPAGLVPDVAGRLGAGTFTVQGLEVDGGLLVGHLLADVVARVVARHGRRPDTVQLVHPDGWTLAQVDALLVAADDAGLGAVSAIGVSEARTALRSRRLAAGEPDHEAAIGAAVVAAASGGALPAPPAVPPTGIVTREDLEGPAPAPPARPLPRYEAEGPRSVF